MLKFEPSCWIPSLRTLTYCKKMTGTCFSTICILSLAQSAPMSTPSRPIMEITFTIATPAQSARNIHYVFRVPANRSLRKPVELFSNQPTRINWSRNNLNFRQGTNSLYRQSPCQPFELTSPLPRTTEHQREPLTTCWYCQKEGHVIARCEERKKKRPIIKINREQQNENRDF